MRLKVYFGKVCAKHPELKGERRLSNRNCVACKREADLRYREENREAAQTYRRKWYEENREAAQTYRRKWHEENREAVLAYKREWYEENREAALAYFRGYREENRETVLAYLRRYRENFKAKHGVTPTTYYRRLRKKEQQCAI